MRYSNRHVFVGLFLVVASHGVGLDVWGFQETIDASAAVKPAATEPSGNAAGGSPEGAADSPAGSPADNSNLSLAAQVGAEPGSTVEIPATEPVAPSPEVNGEPDLSDLEEGKASGARGALESAISWSKEGVEHYRHGRYDEALESLRDARIVLLDADLPEVLQERGLAVLDCALETEMGKLDLEAVLAELESRAGIGAGAELDNRAYIEREARRIIALFGESAPNPESLATFVEEIERYVVFFSGKQRDFYERSYVRRFKYWPTIRKVFEEKRIPIEQGYMAMIESGFNPLARSHADARGLWQFIPGTGRRYGLDRNEDFYDIKKSTEAAAEYLLDLIGIFGSRSFLLATAAYNSGEGRVINCLRGIQDPFGERSFWEIRECFARETREYVPRIFAAAIIASDPHRFGFDLPSPEQIDERFDVVVIPAPTRLATLAAKIGVTEADLRVMNTDLASSATRTPVRNFPIFVPEGKGTVLQAAIDANELPTAPVVVEREIPAVAANGGVSYRVRSGDTLGELSEQFRVSIADLKDWNPELKRRSLRAGEIITIRGQRQSSTSASRAGGTTPPPASPAARRLVYTVKAGNTIEQIADLFTVKLRDILAWNNLKQSAVRPGQDLVIHPPRPLRTLNHVVRKGESPATIASRYGIPVQNVLTANGLGRRTLIQPGQVLVVYAR